MVTILGRINWGLSGNVALVTAVLTLGALAAVLGVMLSAAARRFATAEDKNLLQLVALLPGTNCGACGRPGCEAFAEALRAGDAQPAECTVSSREAKTQIAEHLGVGVGITQRRVARLACAGGDNVASLRAQYVGAPSCAAATLLAGGAKSCLWGCLGFGDCARSCQFDAITLDEHKLPVVDEAACTACGDCLTACPKDLFELVPEDQRLWVACRNEEAGDELLESCGAACTACGRCAHDAPELVRMVGNLPQIEAGRRPDRAAMERCPTGAIVWIDESGHPQRGREAANIVRTRPRRVAAS